jgi:pimeloyl-ACP methyl ester carboxylesterase
MNASFGRRSFLISVTASLLTGLISLADLGTAQATASMPSLEISPQAQWTGSRLVQTQRSLFRCQIEDLVVTGIDPIQLVERDIEISIYLAKRPRAPHSAVLVLPPTGGVNILDRGYANELCSRGLNAVIIRQWAHDDEISLDLSMHDNGALRSLIAVRHVMQYLNTRDINRFGLLGTSIGAMTSALVLGFHPEISASVLIVGSARFADVIASSDETAAAEVRRLRMQKLGLSSLERYRDVIRGAVQLEPARFLRGLASERPFAPGAHLVVTADSDSTVPTEYQHELAQLLSADRLDLEGDHGAVIRDAFIWSRRKLVEHLMRQLTN